MERQLDAASHTVLAREPAGGSPVVVPDEPIPAELVPRATALLEATRAMERTVEQALGEVGGRLGRIADGRRRGQLWADPSPPAFVDRRA